MGNVDPRRGSGAKPERMPLRTSVRSSAFRPIPSKPIAGWFVGRKFRKLGKRPTQRLIHNSKPLMKKAAPTPRDNQIERISGFEIPVSFLLYGAHFVTCPVCQVRVGAPRVRYTSRPRPVRRRGKQSAAISAVVMARRGGNGGLFIFGPYLWQPPTPRVCRKLGPTVVTRA